MNAFAVSTACTWWDSADKAADSATHPASSGLPASLPEIAKTYLPELMKSTRQVCPTCGSRCDLVPEESVVLQLAQVWQDRGHPGFVAFRKWCRGKCYATVAAAMVAYQATGGVVKA